MNEWILGVNLVNLMRQKLKKQKPTNEKCRTKCEMLCFSFSRGSEQSRCRDAPDALMLWCSAPPPADAGVSWRRVDLQEVVRLHPRLPLSELLFFLQCGWAPKENTVISKINVTVSQKPSAINNRQVMSLHCIYMYIHKELGLLYICTQVYFWLSFSINFTTHGLSFFFFQSQETKRNEQK